MMYGEFVQLLEFVRFMKARKSTQYESTAGTLYPIRDTDRKSFKTMSVRVFTFNNRQKHKAKLYSILQLHLVFFYS